MSYDPWQTMPPSSSSESTGYPEGQQINNEPFSLVSARSPLKRGRDEQATSNAAENHGSPSLSSSLQLGAGQAGSFESSLSPPTSSIFASSPSPSPSSSSKTTESFTRSEGMVTMQFRSQQNSDDCAHTDRSQSRHSSRVERESPPAAAWQNCETEESTSNNRASTSHTREGASSSADNSDSKTDQVSSSLAKLPEDEFSSLSSFDDDKGAGQLQLPHGGGGDAADHEGKYYPTVMSPPPLQQLQVLPGELDERKMPGVDHASDIFMSPPLPPTAVAPPYAALAVAARPVACNDDVEQHIAFVGGTDDERRDRHIGRPATRSRTSGSSTSATMDPLFRLKTSHDRGYDNANSSSDGEGIITCDNISNSRSSSSIFNSGSNNKVPPVGLDASPEKEETMADKKPSGTPGFLKRAKAGDRDVSTPTDSRKKVKGANDDSIQQPSRNDSQWQTCYRELLEYKSQHGDCNVPFSNTKEAVLAQWVKRQRYQYKCKVNGKHSHLTDERQQCLEDAGFVWDTHVAAWEENYAKLVEFWKQNGHTHVPIREKELNAWAKRQRRHYKHYCNSKGKDLSSTMNEERIRLLNEIGFAWTPANITSSSSQSMQLSERGDSTTSDQKFHRRPF